MWNSFKNALDGVGDELKFHMGVQLIHAQIIAGLKTWLSDFTIDEFDKMITLGDLPPVDPNIFAQASRFTQYLDSFTVVDICEYIGEASPELLRLIESKGYDGAVYMTKLRQHLIDCCKNPEKAPAAASDSLSALHQQKLVCDKCNKSWLVTKLEGEAIDKCPFCGEKAV